MSYRASFMAIVGLAACGGDEVRISVLAPNQIVAYDDGAATWHPVPIGDDGSAGFVVDGPYTVAAFCSTVTPPRVEVRQGDGRGDDDWRFDCPSGRRSSIGFQLVGSSQNVLIGVGDQWSEGAGLVVPDGIHDVVAQDWVDGKLVMVRDVNVAATDVVVLDFGTPTSQRYETPAGWDSFDTVVTTRTGTRLQLYRDLDHPGVLGFAPSELRSGDRQVTTFSRGQQMRLEIDYTAGGLDREFRDWSGDLQFAEARLRTDGGWLELTFRETGDNSWDERRFYFTTSSASWNIEAHGGDPMARTVAVPDLRTHPGWRDAFALDEQPIGKVELRKHLDAQQTGMLTTYLTVERL